MEDEAGDKQHHTFDDKIFIGLLVFVCHFYYIFATPLLMLCVFQHFSDLDPPTIPTNLLLVVCTDLY